MNEVCFRFFNSWDKLILWLFWSQTVTIPRHHDGSFTTWCTVPKYRTIYTLAHKLVLRRGFWKILLKNSVTMNTICTKDENHCIFKTCPGSMLLPKWFARYMWWPSRCPIYKVIWRYINVKHDSFRTICITKDLTRHSFLLILGSHY